MLADKAVLEAYPSVELAELRLAIEKLVAVALVMVARLIKAKLELRLMMLELA